MADTSTDDARKAEELYRLACDSYASAERRLIEAEVKAGRFLTVLIAALGLSFVTIDTLIEAASVLSLAGIVFLVLVGAAYLSGLFALARFLAAIAVDENSAALLPNKPVAQYFAKHTVSNSLRGLADAFLDAATTIHTLTQEKLRVAKQGYEALRVALVFAVLASFAYYFVDFPWRIE